MMPSFKKFVKAKDMLIEVFEDFSKENAEYNVKWEPGLDTGLAEKDYTARFSVDGDAYVVGFTKQNKRNVLDYYMVWDLDRNRQGWWWTIKAIFSGAIEPFTKTKKSNNKGLKYTMKVIKGVFVCIHDFVEAKRPTIVEYDAADSDLKRFYDNVSMKLAPKFGYAAHHNMIVRQDSLKRPVVKSIITKPLTKK